MIGAEPASGATAPAFAPSGEAGFAEAPRRGFVEIVRRLQALCPDAPELGGAGDARAEAIRLRPSLNLAFPSGEVDAVAEIEATGGRRFEVSVNLPALYGPSSPLPTFVTETLMHGDPGGRMRALLDLIDHRLLSLAYRVAVRGEQTARADDRRLGAVLALLDIGDRPELARYSALLGRQRSADDLGRVLSDRFAPLTVAIEPCIATWTPLGGGNQARLGGGHRVGLDCAIGQAVYSRATTFRIAIAGVAGGRVSEFMPGGSAHDDLRDLVGRFDREGLDWVLELTVDPGSLAAAALGSRGAPLGRDARMEGEAREATRILIRMGRMARRRHD